MRQKEREPWEDRLAKLPLKEGGFRRELAAGVHRRVEQGERQTRRRWVPAAAAGFVLASAVLVAGILQGDRLSALMSEGNKHLQRAWDPAAPAVLKVAVEPGDRFMAAYGNAFHKLHPNVELQPVLPQGDSRLSSRMRPSWADWLDKEKPDVLVLLPGEEYGQLAREGKLLELEEPLRRSGWDLEGLHPGVLQLLREQGGGRLYGLSPEYYQLALYYNRTLFDRYGVPYPKDGMSWEALLQTAAKFGAGPGGRVSGGKEAGTSGQDGGRAEKSAGAVWGLTSGIRTGGMGWARYAARSEGLTYLAPGTQRVQLDTPGWRSLWSSMLEAARSGSLFLALQEAGQLPAEEQEKRHPFLNGQAAMTLEGYDFASRLAEAPSRYGLAAVDWDVAAEPAGPAHPGESASFSLREVYAVNAGSGQRQAALELVKFIAGRAAAEARLAGPDTEAGVPARLRELAVPALAGKHAEAFTRLQPPAVPQPAEALPAALEEQLGGLAAAQFQAALAGRVPPEEALRQLQAQAQAVLDGAR